MTSQETHRGYTLADEEFVVLARRFGEVLTERKIPYVVVGGIATQAHVLDRMCRYHKRNVVSLVSDESIGDTDNYLRATNAIDIALRFPEYDVLEGKTGFELKRLTGRAHSNVEDKIGSICREVAKGEDEEGNYLSCTGNHVFNYVLTESGLKNLEFEVSVGKGARSQIHLKISRWYKDLIGEKGLNHLNPELYNQFIDEGVLVEIPYSGDCSLDLRVLRPEHLLVVKIALDRAKDHMDVKNLVDAMRLEEGFETREDFPKTLFQLRKYLLPDYEKQLLRFASGVGIDVEPKKKQD